MSAQAKPRPMEHYYVFLASPHDVADEREAVRQFFREFNVAAAPAFGINLEVLGWEDLSKIAGRLRPQELIVQRILEEYRDSLVLFIGLMWRRFGTPTGKFSSGTEEEFEWAFKRARQTGSWPEIKFFFRKVHGLPVDDQGSPADIDRELDQWRRVWEFRQKIDQRCLMPERYTDPADFLRVFSKDLWPWLLSPDRPWIQRILPVGVHEPPIPSVHDLPSADDLGDMLRSFALFKVADLPAPANYIIPSIRWLDSGKRIEPRELFEERTKETTATRPFAVISAPGAGKSLLLSQFHSWARRLSSAPQTTALSPRPLVLLINLGRVELKSLEDWPANLIREHLKDCIVSQHDPQSALQALDRSLTAGRVYLFLDGLDEFAIGNKESVPRLIARCLELAEHKIRVTLACRKWFWSYQVPQDHRSRFQVAEIEEFDDNRAIRFLGGRSESLPSNAFVDTEHKCLRDWIRNPQVLVFVRDARRTFASKSDVFRNWTRQSIAAGKARLGRHDLEDDSIRRFFGDVSVLLSRKRTREVKREYWNAGDDATGLCSPTKQPYLDYDLACEFSFLNREGSGDSTQFSHALLWEYFVADRLAAEYENVVSGNARTDYTAFGISLTALDFVPSSVYGFLSETLGRAYESRLIAWLNKPPVPLAELPARLLFNLIEYLGKTSQGTPEALDTLLAVVQDPGLDRAQVDPLTLDPRSLVRYNAARALERLHPGAPRPYFDWASDWGVAMWGDWSFVREVWSPWAIRGSYRAQREPGKSPRMDIDFARAKTVPAPLQQKVCGALMNTLRSSRDAFLQINCSHALIRWYDFRDENLDRELDQAVTADTDSRVRDNLTWVKKAAWALREPPGQPERVR